MKTYNWMGLLYAPAKGDGGDAGGGDGASGDIYPAGGGLANGEGEKVDKGAIGAGDDNANAGAEGGEGGDQGEKGDGDPNDFTDGEKGEGAEGEAGEGEQGEGTPEDGEKKSNLLRLDPETIKELRSGLLGDRQQQQQQENKGEQLSPEQIKQILNPVEVNEQIVSELRSEDPKVAAGAFQKLQLATVKNAVSIARVMIDRKAKEFEAAFAPLRQAQQQQEMSATRNEFFTQHKDLVKYDKVVKAVAAEIDGSGKTREQIFKEVANGARATLKQMGINLTVNPGAGGKTVVPGANKQGPSGRSGGDMNGQKGNGNNPDAEIYGSRGR